MGPAKNLEKISDEKKAKISEKVASVLEKIIVVNKHATPNDMYTISNILHEYDLEF